VGVASQSVTRHIGEMDPSWPRWGKIAYVVAHFALFGAMMGAAGYWVVYPFAEWFAHWYVGATEDWPYAAQMAGIALIPVVLYILAFFAYRRDHRRGAIASPSFWQYVRTGR
jgi:hypothetical protein